MSTSVRFCLSHDDYYIENPFQMQRQGFIHVAVKYRTLEPGFYIDMQQNIVSR